MSPRSEEFMAMAREQLAAARVALEAGFGAASVSLAYYAMLYAARAALSEEDLYAKTHSGTWQLFGQTFGPQRFDADLAKEAEGAQGIRIAADYEAEHVDAERAKSVVELADRFVAAIEELYAD